MPDSAFKTTCRRDLGEEHNHQRCGKPAQYIVWGKLFPKEALGPRCYECAAEQVGHHGLVPGNPQGYAIHHLYELELAEKVMVAQAKLAEMRQRLADCDVLLSEVSVLKQSRADVARRKNAPFLRR